MSCSKTRMEHCSPLSDHYGNTNTYVHALAYGLVRREKPYSSGAHLITLLQLQLISTSLWQQFQV